MNETRYLSRLWWIIIFDKPTPPPPFIFIFFYISGKQIMGLRSHEAQLRMQNYIHLFSSRLALPRLMSLQV
jgi:hypothetical protein